MKTFKYFKKQFAWKHFINYFVIAAVIAVLFIFQGSFSRSTCSTLTRIGYSMILAVSLNLIVGFLGELSLGHAGFMCVGAYIGCYLSNLLEPALGNGLLPLIISMLAGGLVAAVFGLIIGIPALRLKGDYLAITTLAFGEIVRCVFKNLPLFGAAKGLSVTTFNYKQEFLVVFITLFLVLAIIQNLIRSKHGRAITAIRDNEIAARAMGINVTYYKLFVFVLAAFFAGVAGVFYGKSVGKIEQVKFDYNYSIEILVMVVLGGIGSINGSMVAATIITFLNIILQKYLPGSLAFLKNIIYALILIAIIMLTNAPKLAPKIDAMKDAVKGFFKRMFKKKDDEGIIKRDEAEWHRITTKIDMDEVLKVDAKKREGDFVDPDKPERGAK